MNKYSMDLALPAQIWPPLRFRERGQQFEGEVSHPRELLEMFEPIDVLNQATELVDQRGVLITIDSDDPSILEKNEYPRSWEDIHYVVHP